MSICFTRDADSPRDVWRHLFRLLLRSESFCQAPTGGTVSRSGRNDARKAVIEDRNFSLIQSEVERRQAMTKAAGDFLALTLRFALCFSVLPERFPSSQHQEQEK